MSAAYGGDGRERIALMHDFWRLVDRARYSREHMLRLSPYIVGGCWSPIRIGNTNVVDWDW